MKRESAEGQKEVAREPGSASSPAPRLSPSLGAVPPSSCREQQGPSHRPGWATPRPSGGDQPSLALPQPHPGSPAWRTFHPPSLRRPLLSAFDSTGCAQTRLRTPGGNKPTTRRFVAPRSPPTSSLTNPASPPEGGLRTRGARAPPTPPRPATAPGPRTRACSPAGSQRPLASRPGPAPVRIRTPRHLP